MPLFDYCCKTCSFQFEQLARSANDPEGGVCPKCGQSGADRKISRFRVGGRGDLRESTEWHGCHSSVEEGHEHHGHDHHGHDHEHKSSGEES